MNNINTLNRSYLSISFPDGYVRKPFPGGLAWKQELLTTKLPQTTACLCDMSGYCCLGILSQIQERLFNDNGVYRDGNNVFKEGNPSSIVLSPDNPAYKYIGEAGDIPKEGIIIRVYYNDGEVSPSNPGSLAGFNDIGFSFKMIAAVLDQIWKLS